MASPAARRPTRYDALLKTAKTGKVSLEKALNARYAKIELAHDTGKGFVAVIEDRILARG